MPSTSITRSFRRAARPSSRRSQSTRDIGNKLECAAQARIVAQKRIPLATKSNANGSVAPAPTTQLSLPRTLPRPVVGEVEMASLVSAYPNLAGIPAEYIRKRLPLSTPTMRAALQAIEASAPRSSLPKELEILMNDVVSAACPTHFFAVYSDAPLTPGQKRHVSLYPFHDLVIGAHCANLPALPASQPSPYSVRATLPVVPLSLPSPETFSLLHAYLYMQQQPETLLAALAPPCGANLLQLAGHAQKIQGLWRNACVLAVVDEQLYDVIESSWERTIAAMQAC